MARTWLLGLTAALVCAGPLMVALSNPSEDQVIDRPVIAPLFEAENLPSTRKMQKMSKVILGLAERVLA